MCPPVGPEALSILRIRCCEHVWKDAHSRIRLEFRVEFRCPAGKNDRAYFNFNNLFFLIEIYGMRAAHFFRRFRMYFL